MCKEIEIPFGAYDSELGGFEYTIPDGFVAEINEGKVIVKKKESEDDTIRQCIGLALTDVDEQRFKDFGTTLKECLAYLEKQKVNTDGDFARGYSCGYECCLNSHGAEWFGNQKDPHYTKRNALFDKCVENCDPEVMKSVSDEVDEMLEKEQKFAWSKEDEEMRDRILEFINKYGTIPVSGGKVQLRFNKEYMWLKSLPERIN